MSESRDFCSRCSDPVPERPEPLPGMPRERGDVLCGSCYFEDFDLVNVLNGVQTHVYAQYGTIRRDNRWMDVGMRDYTDIVTEEVSNSLGVHLNAKGVHWGVESEQVDENNIQMHCYFSDVVRGTSLEESTVVPVSIVRETCQRYGCIVGGYFASLVQVRADDRTPTAEEAEMTIETVESYTVEREDKGGRNAFITEVNRMPSDPNIKISTNQTGSGVMKQIRERPGDTIEEHPVLVTKDGNGNEVYRVTFVARLLRYTVGDVIDPEDGDGPVLARGNRGRLKRIRLTPSDLYESEFEEGERPKAEDPGSIENVAETTVVTIEDEHAVQALDPETHEAKTIPRPDCFDPGTSMVPVLKNPSGPYISPEEVVDDDEE